MGVTDRIALAHVSNNLADNPLKLSDVDFLRAAGWAAQISPDGLMLYRLKYANDHREYKATLQRMYSLAVYKAHRDRIKIKSEELWEIAENTLRHWVAPVCPACLGRGYKVQESTPLLSDIECKHCNGSGQLPLNAAVKSHIKLAEWISMKMDEKVGAFVSSAKNSTA